MQPLQDCFGDFFPAAVDGQRMAAVLELLEFGGVLPFLALGQGPGEDLLSLLIVVAQGPVAGGQGLVPSGAGVVADLTGGGGFGVGADGAEAGVEDAEAGQPQFPGGPLRAWPRMPATVPSSMISSSTVKPSRI
jgi:hypothetical protein